MINLDSITNKNNKEHNEKWPYIPDHPYRIIIIGGFESSKTNALINFINEQTKSIHHWVTLPLIVCNYLKSLSQEAKDLMDELEDANNDIGYNKLLYIGDKEKFNFNVFSIPLNFLLDIFNGK